MASAISVRGLVKEFGKFRALDGLDLEVREGEVHGFLGPNGSGKSTTIRILLGVMRASGGRVTLLGGDPWRDALELHRRIAYVPGEVSLWPNLTGGEAIDLLTRLRGGVDPRRRDELIERFELDPTKKGRDYSKGNRQKVALVAALACDAELLIADEPTAGLDPLKEAEFQACVGEMRERGQTVLLSSHILAEVEALCDRVTIIRAGRTVEQGAIDEMRHLRRSLVRVETAREVDRRSLEAQAGVHGLSGEGRTLAFELDAEGFEPAMRVLAEAGIRALTSSPPTLQQLFLHHYSEDGKGEPGGEVADNVHYGAAGEGGPSERER